MSALAISVTFTAHQTARASDMEQLKSDIQTAFNNSIAAQTFTQWVAYTPTLSAGLTLGAGSILGRYTQKGKEVRGKILATLGAGFTASGATITWSLPVTGTASDTAGFTTQVIGVWNHAGVAYPLVGSVTYSSSTLTVGYFAPNGANPIYSTTLGNPGFTSGDTIFIDFSYESAA